MTSGATTTTLLKFQNQKWTQQWNGWMRESARHVLLTCSLSMRTSTTGHFAHVASMRPGATRYMTATTTGTEVE